MNSSGTNGTSLYELTRAMSTYRYYTPDWLDKITQEKSDVVISKEWVLIRSQRLFLDWKRQELKQLVTAALAATNG